MKNSVIIEPGPSFSTLFQMAAQMDVTPLPRISHFAPTITPRNLPNSKTYNVRAKSMKRKKPTTNKAGENKLKLPGEFAAGKNTPTSNNGNLKDERKTVEFLLVAPDAGSVKIAADFTDWEKSPFAMIKGENGKWSAAISLPPGQYSYRFIVDGEWRDDPASTRRQPNPFGTANSAVDVV